MSKSDKTWSEVVDPICTRLETAAKFGQCWQFNATGCEAHALFLRGMARSLDRAIELLEGENG